MMPPCVFCSHHSYFPSSTGATEISERQEIIVHLIYIMPYKGKGILPLNTLSVFFLTFFKYNYFVLCTNLHNQGGSLALMFNRQVFAAGWF